MHVLKSKYNRGSTNMDLSRDDEGATQDRSNAPITTPHDPEQVNISLIHGLNHKSYVSQSQSITQWHNHNDKMLLS